MPDFAYTLSYRPGLELENHLKLISKLPAQELEDLAEEALTLLLLLSIPANTYSILFTMSNLQIARTFPGKIIEHQSKENREKWLTFPAYQSGEIDLFRLLNNHNMEINDTENHSIPEIIYTAMFKFASFRNLFKYATTEFLMKEALSVDQIDWAGICTAIEKHVIGAHTLLQFSRFAGRFLNSKPEQTHTKNAESINSNVI